MYQLKKSKDEKENLLGATNTEKEMEIRALVQGQETERKRISENLHDGLGQALSMIKLNLSALKNDSNAYKSMMVLIEEAIIELRGVTQNLMPSVLEKSGLVAALSDFCRRANQTEDLDVDFYHEGYAPKPLKVELELFRMAQEAVNNALKHSNATEISVQLQDEGEVVSIMIEDNGRGFDSEKELSNPGNGLWNIRSRARLLGGEVEFDTKPGEGTVVSILIQSTA